MSIDSAHDELFHPTELEQALPALMAMKLSEPARTLSLACKTPSRSYGALNWIPRGHTAKPPSNQRVACQDIM